MDEETTQDTAAFLHAFGPDTTRALKREKIRAEDMLLLCELYGEAQRLQGIVTRLTREEQTLRADMTTVADHHTFALQQLEHVNGQLANNERLLDEARKGAQARIVAEMDTWRDQQHTARVQELDGLMAEGQQELAAMNAALLVVQREVKDTEVEQTRLQAAVEILRQTRLDLVGEIAAVG